MSLRHSTGLKGRTLRSFLLLGAQRIGGAAVAAAGSIALARLLTPEVFGPASSGSAPRWSSAATSTRRRDWARRSPPTSVSRWGSPSSPQRRSAWIWAESAKATAALYETLARGGA
jgi:hypothetical protein